MFTVRAPLIDRAIVMAHRDPRAAVVLIEREANGIARELLLRKLADYFAR